MNCRCPSMNYIRNITTFLETLHFLVKNEVIFTMNFVVVHSFLKVFYDCNIWWWPCKAEIGCILILNSSKFELWLMVPLFLFYVCLTVGCIHESLLEGCITGIRILSIMEKTASIRFYHCVPLGIILFLSISYLCLHIWHWTTIWAMWQTWRLEYNFGNLL
jgi:hypothetical protein